MTNAPSSKVATATVSYSGAMATTGLRVGRLRASVRFAVACSVPMGAPPACTAEPRSGEASTSWGARRSRSHHLSAESGRPGAPAPFTTKATGAPTAIAAALSATATFAPVLTAGSPPSRW
jgi:hypothetical protein